MKPQQKFGGPDYKLLYQDIGCHPFNFSAVETHLELHSKRAVMRYCAGAAAPSMACPPRVPAEETFSMSRRFIRGF